MRIHRWFSGRSGAWIFVGVCMAVVSIATARPATPSPEARAAHALNRLGYGPRPGEVEKVAALGVEEWMRTQLCPENIPDAAAEARVEGLARLKLTRAELVEAYEKEIRERRRLQRERAAAEAEGKAMERPRPSAAEEAERLVVAEALGQLQHAKLARAVLSERQLEEVLVDFWFNHFNVDARKGPVRATVVSYEQEAIRPHVFGNFRDLLGATAKSAAMLVYLDNFRSSREQELSPREQAAAERLRREVLGEPEPPMGKAAAGEAAMGEAAASTAPAQLTASGAPAAPAAPMKRGLNENYGRELLELHTLGVDGGYTQKDVQEVARAFTGWTLDPRTGAFVFRARWHDDGAKTILGQTFPAGGGRQDGERVLDLLATHPSTARRIAFKLCQRFVADEPPADLVERVAAVFLKTRGDLRATYEALFFDPEFFAPEHLHAKTKSPFEFAASALRAAGAELVDPRPGRMRLPLRAVEAGATLGRGGDRLAQLPRKTVMLHLVEMGQPLYAWGPPTGFSERSADWVGAGALVARINFALALTGGQVHDARATLRPLLGDTNPDRAEAVVDALAKSLFGAPPSEATRRVLLAQAAPAEGGATALPDLPKLLALLLGSPEFQRR